MEGIHGARAVAVQQLFCDGGGIRDGFLRRGHIGGNLGGLGGGEVIADGIGNDEVAVGQALHERAGAETVGTVIGEVGFAENEQTGNRGHQVVVHPEAAHGVVTGGIDAHGNFVGILAGDALVHFEEVAVALGNFVFSETLDRIGEIEVDAKAGFADTAASIALGLGGAGSDVARDEIAETGVAALEIVVALGFGDLSWAGACRRAVWEPRCGRRCEGTPTSG